jgi:predicted HicB family RNase H-like nuclease
MLFPFYFCYIPGIPWNITFALKQSALQFRDSANIFYGEFYVYSRFIIAFNQESVKGKDARLIW